MTALSPVSVSSPYDCSALLSNLTCIKMTLFDRNGKAVSKIKNIESGGQTQDFETFYFDEPVAGSRIRLDVKGTTAGQWNAVAEVRGLGKSRFLDF